MPFRSAVNTQCDQDIIRDIFMNSFLGIKLEEREIHRHIDRCILSSAQRDVASRLPLLVRSLQATEYN